MRNAKSQAGSNALNEGAKAGDGLAYNQVLHLVRSFVRVQCFSVCEKASHVVVGGNAVSAQQLPGPGDGLAALGRAERFRKRRMRVRQFAFGLQLGHAYDQALRSRNVDRKSVV